MYLYQNETGIDARYVSDWQKEKLQKPEVYDFVNPHPHQENVPW